MKVREGREGSEGGREGREGGQKIVYFLRNKCRHDVVSVRHILSKK